MTEFSTGTEFLTGAPSTCFAEDGAPPPISQRRPDKTSELTRGVARLFRDMGLAILPEFQLPTGRRVDLAGLNEKGRIIVAEIKSCRADFEADRKWTDYLDFCDAFYFAVDADFPRELLPPDEGLIVADAFGTAILRHARDRALAPARRKALTLRFARQAACRNMTG
ncbi:MAG: MmcB family DNA repair protein [Alphaproteobacteria bacterium]|nr:MmcB family DNA repair protein [Alphaproteobacteria bacterium]